MAAIIFICLTYFGIPFLLQHHSSNASILQRSAFFTVQLSYPYMTTGEIGPIMICHSLGSPEADKEMKFGLQVRLLLGRKVMTNLDNILKCRHITLPTKVHLVKAMIFPVVMYGCETVKKAEHRRIDVFEL